MISTWPFYGRYPSELNTTLRVKKESLEAYVTAQDGLLKNHCAQATISCNLRASAGHAIMLLLSIIQFHRMPCLNPKTEWYVAASKF